MEHYEFEKVISAFIADPTKAIAIDWKPVRNGNAIWTSNQHLNGKPDSQRKGATIKLTKTGLPIIFDNGGYGFEGNFWKYFAQVYGVNHNSAEGQTEIIANIAPLYGIQPDFSNYTPEQREAYAKRKADADKMQIVAKFLTDALNAPEGAATRDYLAGRKLQPSPRLGAYNGQIRANLKAYLMEATQEPTTDIDAFIKRALRDNGRPDAYQLAIPFFTGRRCAGIALRKTLPTKYDADGNEIKDGLQKYSNSAEMAKGGYLTEIKAGLPFIVVEGYLDAERLKQAGLAEQYNVFAIGAQHISQGHPETLLRYGAEELILIQDYEHEGHEMNSPVVTKYTATNIEHLHPFLKARHDAEGFISLRIADLCDNASEKQDADSFIQQYGVSAFIDRLDNAKNYYEWEMTQAVAHLTGAKLADEAQRIYKSIPNITDRNILRRSIQKGTYGQRLAEVGFNSRVMNAIDNNTDAETYRAKIEKFAADAQALHAADNIEEAFEGLMERAARIRAGKEDIGFMADLNATFSQIEEQQRDIPEPIQTRWQMYRTNRNGETKEWRRMEFDANEVNFICAPTSHGKTRILIQTALNFVEDFREPILYVSLEQGAATLNQLALSAYIGEGWKEYKKGDARQELRAAISGDMPDSNIDFRGWRKAYERNIYPYLKFVKARQDIDTICTNIREAVEGWRDNGHNPQCVMIDHAQLLSADTKAHSRTDEVSSICDALNNLAKELHIAVIVASQFNRETLRNTNKNLDGGFETIDTYNISQSSAIENIASYVYMAFNTNYLELKNETTFDKLPKRQKRCAKPDSNGDAVMRENCMYVECLKGRYSGKGHYCLLPFRPDTGYIASENSDNYDKSLPF